MLGREINLANPETWEFSGFSQNGEDGIIDVLRKQLKLRNRYSIEIGAADGVENNTSWLIVAEKYNGLLIDGNPKLIERIERVVARCSIGALAKCSFVTKDNVSKILELSLHQDPDVFSLDIDGNDYYIAERVLNIGIRPKIFVVEYNSAFGPCRAVTIEYNEVFDFKKAHPSCLYYGASISGWRRLFDDHGYRFVTVDRNGVNAFFVDPQAFDDGFVERINGLPFAENQYQLRKFRVPHQGQYNLIKDCPVKKI